MMIMILDDVEPNKKVSIKSKIRKQGIKLFNEFYFNEALIDFLHCEVEVEHEVLDLSVVWVVLPNGKRVEAKPIDFSRREREMKPFLDKAFVISDDQMNANFDLIEARILIRKLEIALSKALNLRGLTAAINDPLALAGEKEVWRENYADIENEVREAWLEAKDFLEK